MYPFRKRQKYVHLESIVYVVYLWSKMDLMVKIELSQSPKSWKEVWKYIFIYIMLYCLRLFYCSVGSSVLCAPGVVSKFSFLHVLLLYKDAYIPHFLHHLFLFIVSWPSISTFREPIWKIHIHWMNIFPFTPISHILRIITIRSGINFTYFH